MKHNQQQKQEREGNNQTYRMVAVTGADKEMVVS